jgi:hypothetical protein
MTREDVSTDHCCHCLLGRTELKLNAMLPTHAFSEKATCPFQTFALTCAWRAQQAFPQGLRVKFVLAGLAFMELIFFFG